MSIVKTNIVTEFGAYYVNQGQNMESLKDEIRQPAVTPGYAELNITENDIYRFSNTFMGEIVQQFQKAFTPKGDLTFEPNEIRLRNLKIDLALYPDDVKASYLGFLAGKEKADRKDWPIVRYIIEKKIIPQLKHDMETRAYFTGSWVAPTAGTAGSAIGTIDGVKKLLDAGLAETNLTKQMHAVTLSAAPGVNNSFAMLEEFSDNIDELLAATPTTIYCSVKRVKAFLRDKRNKYGDNINYDANKLTIDFDSNKKIVGLPSMGNSDYIWATPDFNFLYLRKSGGQSDPKVEEALRQVFLMLDWWEGIGFGANPLVYCYKPA